MKCPHCQQEITLDTPRAGAVLGVVRQLFDETPDWTADELCSRVNVPRKQIYNSVGYLVRRKVVANIGYGKYRLIAERASL
jgi:DNA-binding IclR family transcriptional regulator